MVAYQLSDLVFLARGPVSPAALRAIVTDRVALAKLEELTRVLCAEQSLDFDPANLTPVDIGFDVLARFVEQGRLCEPAERAAAERAIALHLPELAAVAPAPTPPRQSRWRELSRHLVASVPAWSLTASIVVAVGCVVGWVATVTAKHREANQLRRQRDEQERQKEQIRWELESVRQKAHGHGVTRTIEPPVIDTSRLEFDRGREYSIRESSKPGNFVLQLSPYLGPPYYVGLQIDWGDDSPLEEVYHHEFVDFKPLAAHPYALPRSGDTRCVEVQLVYRLSGHAMHKFKLDSDVIRKRIPLVLMSKGVRIATGRIADAISASVHNPREDGGAVPEQFTLELGLKPPGGAPHKTGFTDRMIYILIRPLDGPEPLRKFYYVQPFTQRVSALFEAGPTEQQFMTWVALPGAKERRQHGVPGPERYEILVVEWPDRFVNEVVPKDVLDFDEESLKLDTVRARRVVRFDPKLNAPPGGAP